MIGDGLVELGDHLGVVVVAGILGREVGRRDGHRAGQGNEQESDEGGWQDTHAGQSDGSDEALPPARWG